MKNTLPCTPPPQSVSTGAPTIVNSSLCGTCSVSSTRDHQLRPSRIDTDAAGQARRHNCGLQGSVRRRVRWELGIGTRQGRQRRTGARTWVQCGEVYMVLCCADAVRAVLHNAALCCVALGSDVLRCAVLCCAVLCCTVPCCSVSCCAAPAVLYDPVLCWVVCAKPGLCCALPCLAVKMLRCALPLLCAVPCCAMP
jgi:hypothetical protein